MHEAQIPTTASEEQKISYMREILLYLATCDPELSSPALVKPLSKICEKYWGKQEGMERQKKEFNDFLLSMEKDLEQQILSTEDPLKAALGFARTGNYIDYAAIQNVSREKLLELFQKPETTYLDPKEYNRFLSELSNAKKLIYLTDNCGEIVLDKIAIKILRSNYPNLVINVIVRGAPVVNDADMPAAKYIGLDKIVPVMDNGSDIAGTDLSAISEDAKKEILSADLILSKGQGNFETLHGCGLNIYYLFLCKCDWFVQKFHAKKLQGMFVNEQRIDF